MNNQGLRQNNLSLMNNNNSNLNNYNNINQNSYLSNNVEFPSLNNNYTYTSNNNTGLVTQKQGTTGNNNINNSKMPISMIADDEFNSNVYLKDNSNMINRIKSSTHVKLNSLNKKRINSAYPVNVNENKNTSFVKSNSNITLLYEENQKLKIELAKLKNDITVHKKEITYLENELEKKDKMIDDIADTSNINQTVNDNTNNISAYTAKIIESKLMVNLKKQYRDVKKDLAKKVEEIEEMKKLLKSTKLNELSIENQTLSDELNKIKKFYKASQRDNSQVFRLQKEFHTLQENFSKQQFLIISLQEKIENDGKELDELRSEVLKDKTIIAERNKKIIELKRNIKSQIEYTNKIANFKENSDEFQKIKATWEKKMAELKKDLLYYKQTSEQNGARKKDLEDQIKRLREQIKPNASIGTGLGNRNDLLEETLVKQEEVGEESLDVKVKIYKTKLQETNSTLRILEAENDDLKKRLKQQEIDKPVNRITDNNGTPSTLSKNEANQEFHGNGQIEQFVQVDRLDRAETDKDNEVLTTKNYLENTKLKVENTNLSSNLLSSDQNTQEFDITEQTIKQMKPLSEDSFNEIIYILMKNFEANKIDSSVIDSVFNSTLNENRESLVRNLAKNIMYLLKK